jgi:hypothetical protein
MMNHPGDGKEGTEIEKGNWTDDASVFMTVVAVKHSIHDAI